MKVAGDWLRAEGTQEVLGRLTRAGHQAFAVGGCVRNDLLGAPVADIDIATSATPEETMAACDGLRCVPTGIDHGTITVIAGGIPHEVTTYRKDVETDGRHARVVFGTDIAQDAARRDFTMNALYAGADGEVVDPLAGLSDLAARRVRFIGSADARIAEDYLRILRFFRFTAWYGIEMDAEGLAACASGQEGLDRISAERIGHEMRKLLAAPDPAPVVATMAQAGILGRILPGSDAKALPVLVHLEGGGGTSPTLHWVPRLAALGGDLDGLRLSKTEAKHVATLRAAATGTGTPFALGHTLGADMGHQALLLRAALLETPLATEGLRDGATATFPLSARDLSPRAGPQLGQALAAARGRWLATLGTADARALLAWLEDENL